MSIDYHVHIGPYIKCRRSTVQDVTTVRTCPNEGCKKHLAIYNKEIAFCSDCGTKILEKEIPRNRPKVSFEDVEEKFGGTFLELLTEYNQQPENIYVSNIKREHRKDGGFDFDPHYCSGFFQNFDGEDIANGIETFTNEFAEEIEGFKELYGDSNVEVAWGVILDVR
jgi:hypothetical protein